MCDDIDYCLKQLTSDGNDDLAFGVSRIRAISTASYVNDEIFCFDRTQNIANYTISLAFRSDYKFTSEINRVILSVLEGGLNVKWQRDNRITPSDNSGQNINLGLEYLQIIFYFVYFPGLFVAISTFFLELFVTKKIREAQTVRERKFWIRIEYLLDGRRHMFKSNRD